ncbi:MAG: ThuA domain-containing protein [Novosphingobium sp.]
MKRILKILMWILLAVVALFAVQTIRYWDTIQRTMLGGYHTHETVPPQLPAEIRRPAVLIFSKTNGFRHEEAIPAGNKFFAELANARGWGHFQTENGAVMSPAILSRFDVVVFDNASGDMFSPDQQAALKAWLENGGGYVGLHAAGDSSHAGWQWYQDELIGARFTQHTMAPQFQDALVNVENRTHPAVKDLPASWKRTEEWYSFEKSPRAKGFTILATVDEKSYNPEGMFGKDLRMGDHPVAWAHCIGKGRVFYTAFGHRAEAFAEPETKVLLANALGWALKQDTQSGGTDYCPPPTLPGIQPELKR